VDRQPKCEHNQLAGKLIPQKSRSDAPGLQVRSKI
jgi:hypothetical protein